MCKTVRVMMTKLDHKHDHEACWHTLHTHRRCGQEVAAALVGTAAEFEFAYATDDVLNLDRVKVVDVPVAGPLPAHCIVELVQKVAERGRRRDFERAEGRRLTAHTKRPTVHATKT